MAVRQTGTLNSWNTWPDRVLESLWLTAAVIVPLAFNPWGQNAFELPKTALLKTLALLMGLVTLIQVIEGHGAGDPQHRPRVPRALLWPALAYGLALVLATVFSTNLRASLWGSYDRQQGLLTSGAYLALFLLTAFNLRNRAQIERLWMAIVWGSAPVVVYGLLQALGLDPLDWRTDAASPVLSTVGRANFLGSYLVLVIPLTLARVLSVCALPIQRRWFCFLLLVSQLVCLVLTQARGAWIGLGAAIVAGLLAWSLATRNRRPALAALIVLTLMGSFVALLNLANGPLAPLAQLPGLDRLAMLTHTDVGSTAARLTIWRATLPLIAVRPWLGYGPETMRPVFAHVFPPQLVYYQGRHAVVDRAHNLWLDLGMGTGLVGLVAFVALLVGVGWLVWRGLRAAGESKDRSFILWVALAAAVAGHLTDLQFGFDLTTSATVFWLALTTIAALESQSSHKGHQEREDDPGETVKMTGVFGAGEIVYLPPVLVALALIALVCLRPLLADAAYWRSKQDTRVPEERLAAAEQAVRLWPLEPEYRVGLAWVYLQDKSFTAAEGQLSAAGRLNPRDPWVWAACGELYAYWSEVEPGRLIQAEAAYRQALELAPNVATSHTSLGLVLVQQGRLVEGLAELERAVALDATDGIAYGYLADLYQVLGQEDEADWARKEAERWRSE